MRLALKLALAILPGVLAVLAVSAYVTSRWEDERRRQQIRVEQARQVEIVAGLVSNVWASEGQAFALRALERSDAALPDTSVRWVWLEDAAGPEQTPRVSPDELGGVTAGEIAHARGPDERLYTYAAESPAGRLGAVELAGARGGLGASSLVWPTVALAAILAAVTLGIAALAGRRLVSRPVAALAAVARRVGQGDYAHRADLHRRDELGDLGREVDAMGERLEELEHDRESGLEQLRYADRLSTVGQIASSIAHEVGTPMNVVSGRASMMASGLIKNEDVPENAKIIVEQTKRMASIIRQLLEFARRGTGSIEDIDVQRLVADVFQLLRPTARKRNVTLVAAETDEHTVVRGDPAKLQQVLANLIVNGIHAMPDGGTLDVSMQVCHATAPPDYDGHSGRFLRVSVCDEGHGIRPENRRRIFEAFYTTKDVGEGTGLGLSVADDLVREHRGWIHVESEVGKRTCFHVFLPHGEPS